MIDYADLVLLGVSVFVLLLVFGATHMTIKDHGMSMNGVSKIKPNPTGWKAPSVEDAKAMGANGGPAIEQERLAFEAWMSGHCWKVSGDWNGTQYVHEEETGGYVCPHTMQTRMLWAAWRDRAALANLGVTNGQV